MIVPTMLPDALAPRRAPLVPEFAGRTSVITLGFAVMTALLVMRAMLGAVDHDEDQYLAGAALAADHVLFRDFMHLQTPLQALLFAPIADVFGGHAYVALRIANALFAAGMLGIVFAAQRLAGVSRGAALVSTLLLFFCQSFQHSASVIRNDVLPAFFSALAIAAGVAAGRSRRPLALWALTGLFFGLATSSKISHALLAAGAGLHLLWNALRGRADRDRWLAMLAYGLGGLAGLVPSLIYLVQAPEAFLWGVVEYGARAPFDWYHSNGLDEQLTLGAKVRTSLDALSQGPGLLALAAVGASVFVRRRREAPIAFLDALVVAGLVGALLPTPTLPYYFMTLLPPLFVRFGLLLDDAARLGRGWRLAALALLAVSIVLAVDWRTRAVLATPVDDTPVGRTQAESRWIGATLQRLKAHGTVASLAPRAVVDSGYPIDRRFATGVFVFRSGGLLEAAEHERFHTVGPKSLAASLDRDPPAAILTGYEDGSKRFYLRPDDALRTYARSRGYRLFRGPGGRAELYINPDRSGMR